MKKYFLLLFFLEIITISTYGQCGTSPQATFTAAITATPTGTTACNGQNIAYNFSASPAPAGNQYTYSWNFGQPSSGSNNTATTANAPHNFGSNSNNFNAGTYTVTLIVKDTVGIDSCAFTTFVVNTGPPSGILPLTFTATAAGAASCTGQPNQYHFVPSLVGSQYIYSWNFGQTGATSTSATPNYTFGSNSNSFQTNSNYTVTLMVIDTVGRDTCYTTTDVVTTGPNAGNFPLSFTATPSATSCNGLPNQYSFTPNTGNGYIYSWVFGQSGAGNTSLSANPTHTFGSNANSFGTSSYNVTLYAIDTTGQDACTSVMIPVTSSPISSTPASFTWSPNSPCAGTTVINFVGSPASNNQHKYIYSWDFGGLGTASIKNPTFTFPFNGSAQTYTVSLIVIDTVGKDTCRFVQNNITVGPASPITVNISPANNWNLCTAGLNPTTQNQTTVTFVIPLPSNTYSWTVSSAASGATLFSTTNSTNTLVYTFNGFGSYIIKVYLPGSNCPSFQRTFKFYTNPIAAMSLLTNPYICEGDTVTVINNSIPGTADDYSWDWGDGTPMTVVQDTSRQTHVYHLGPATCNDAAQIITLYADNACFAPHTNASPIYVKPIPRPQFSAPSTACVNQPVSFQEQSCPSNNLSGFMTYTWNFGDGSPLLITDSTAGPVYQHTYTQTGVYNVTLTVNIANACASDSIMKTITIIGPPVWNVTATPHIGCKPLVANFTNNSTPSANTYTWTVFPNTGFSFTNGTNPNSVNPQITFNTVGMYVVTETANNICGTAIKKDTFYVKDKPIITYTPPAALQCIPVGASTLTLNFSATPNANGGTLSPANPAWTFTGGIPNTASGTTVGPITFGAGIFPLTVSSTNECGTTIRKDTLIVREFPNAAASFAFNNTNYCVSTGNPLVVNCTNLTTPTGAIYTYTWSWTAPGATLTPSSTLQNPTFTYPVTTYNNANVITLYATNQCGTDTMQKQIRIKNAPTVSLATIPNVCLVAPNTSVNITPILLPATNLGNTANPIYSWTFTTGTPTPSPLPNPTANFAAGNHTAQIIVSNECGSATASRSFIVTDFAQANATYTLSDTNYCTFAAQPLTLSFTGQATPTGSTYAWASSSLATPSTSTSANPVFTYQPNLTYNGTNSITLTVTPPNNCPAATATYTFRVKKAPVITTVPNIQDQCLTVGTTSINITPTPTATYNVGNSANPTYTWTFSGGCTPDTSYLANPTGISTPLGGHNFVVSLKNECGTVTSSDTFTLRTKPTANASLSFAPTNNCATAGNPLIVTATNLSTNTTWSPGPNWTVTNGSFVPPSTNTSQNPVFSFPSSGNVSVSLTYTNTCGSDTWTQSFPVKTVPTVNINTLGTPCLNGSSTTVTLNPTANFVANNGTFGANAFSWNFGTTPGISPQFSTNQIPGNVIFPAGNHPYWASATNECGTTTANASVVIGDFPHANATFTANNIDSCASTTTPFSLSFTSLSTPVGGITHYWVVSPSTGVLPSDTSTFPNPTFNFTQSGTYTVTLTVGNGCGSHQWIKVFHIKEKPIVILAPISNVCLVSPNTSVNLTPSSNATTTGGGSNVSYLWTYTGGTSTSQNLGATNFTAGNDTIKIKVGNECGSDSASRSFTVTDFPQAIATIAPSNVNYCTSAATPLTVSFTGQALPSGATYSWSAPSANLPDTSTSANPTFSYANAGTNNIVLTVTAPNGCTTTSQAIYPISVKAAPTDSLLSISPQCLTASTITANVTPLASYTLGNSTNNTYAWSFSNCVPDTAITQVAPTISCDSGLHNVQIIVANECGSDTANTSFTVTPFPIANAILTFNPTTNCALPGSPLIVTATNLSTPLGGTPLWNPGTGGSFVSPSNASSPNPIFSYLTNGTATISLSYTNICGTANWSQNITVKTLPTVTSNHISAACLTGASSTISLNPNASYGNGGGTISAYSWNFGTAVGVNPPPYITQNPGAINFPAGNNHYWTSVTNECGTSIANDSVLVGDFPHANASFVINNSDTCTSTATPFSVGFTSLSTPVGIINHHWVVNPSSGVLPLDTSNLPNPTFNFTQSGTYTVTLTAGNGCGSHQWTQVFHVKARPDISLVPIQDLCLGAGVISQSFTPNPSYTDNGAAITAYNWTFQTALNNPPTNIDYPTNVIFGEGNNVITVIAENVCGKDTASNNFTITAFPHASATATVNDANICTYSATPFQVTLTNNSTPNGIPPSIGATNGAIVSGNVITFPSTGVSNITLTCSNICGTDDTTFTYNVHALPTVDVLPIPDGCGFMDLNPYLTTNITDGNGTISNYSWAFQNGSPTPVVSATNPDPGVIHFTPTLCSAYLNVTNQCGSVSDVSNFSVVGAANLVGSNDTVLCSNVAPITIHCEPAGGQWNSTVSNVNPIGNQSFATFTPSVAGTFYAIYTYGSGNCLRIDTVKIIVNAAPNVDAGLPFGICADAAAQTLSGTPVGGCFTGSGIANCTQFNPTTVAPSATPYIVTYTYTDANQCTSSDQVQITVNPLPVVNAGLDTTFCFTSTPQILVGNSPANGVWSNNIGISNAATGEFIPSVAGAGNHTLVYTFTDGNGCVNKDSIVAHIILKDSISAGTDQSICYNGGLLALTGYYPLSNAVWTGSGVSGNTFNPLITGVTTVTLTYTTGSGSCQTSDTKNVTIFPVPSVNAGQIVSSCISDSVVNLGNGTPVGGYWTGFMVNNNQFFPNAAGIGTYPITYHFADGNGCIDSNATSIIVNPLPQVQFSVPLVSCKGSPVSFNNQSTGTTQYAWAFGDSGTSFAQNPSHVYADTGHFEVTLIGTSGASCMDSMKFTLQIIDVPSPSFLMTPDTACSSILANGAGVIATFVDNSLNWGGNYFWDFGNGITDTLHNPPSVFFYEGVINDTSYVITLDIGNMCGVATFKDTLHIYSLPKAVFGTNVNSGCSPAPFLISNSSLQATSWFWDFGNGATSTLQSPPTQYITGDTITVLDTITLVVGNQCGFDTATHVVTIYPNTVNAFFNANPISGCAPLTVNVMNYSNGTNISYNMGPAVPNPTITFPTAGTYVLKQYANNGCSYDTMAVTITVNAAPTVNFASQPIICQSDTAIFTNNTTNAVSYSWNFGDNTTLSDVSNLANPIYVYPTAGNHLITLTAYANTTLCVATASQTVNVKPAPSIDFALSDTIGCAAFVVNVLNNTSSGAFHFWDLGAASPTTPNNIANPAFSCPTQGIYPITYTNTDGFGCHSDTTFSVVAEEKPVAAFTPSALSACGTPATFSFSNQSTGTNIAYSWNFGNTANPNTIQSNLANPSITFTSTGTFNVTLIAGNSFDCADTLIIPITVYPQPNANFNISPTQGCAPLTVSFTNATTNATTYSWDFGNGALSNSTLQNPAPKTYAVPNNYTITLYTTYQNQCFDTATVTLPVLPKPVSDFNFTTSGNICGGPYTLTFNNLSQNATTYSWNFHNGVANPPTSTLANPTYTFNSAGTYIISLTALNGVGCVHTFKDTIVIHPQPNANVLVQPTVGCAPLTTTFVNLSTNYTTTSWYYGDNTTPPPFVGNNSPAHTYALPDTYSLQVITNYQNVCFDTTIVPITVVPLPIANFTYSPTTVVCGAPAPFTFVNTSQMAQNYLWNFGNALPPTTAFDTTIVYQNTGVFPVTLVATNYLGCTNTVTQNITVNPQPNASFSVSPTQGCAPLTVNVTNTTTNATNYSWDWGNTALISSSLQNPPAQTYNTVGNGTPPSYTITLYANYQNQCFDTASVTIPVLPQPISDFNFTTSGTYCAGPYTLTFNNLSQHSTHYSWNFGNGVTDTLANPTYTYNNVGTYIISLTSYNDYGCTHTSFDTITVHPQPQANVTASPTQGCAPLTVNFTNNSTFCTHAVWDYQDASSLQNTNGTLGTNHIFTLIDTFNVEVIVDYQGLCFDTAIVPVIVQPQPVAEFSFAEAGTICGGPDTLTFNNLSQNATAYSWNFDNGVTTASTSIVANPTFICNSPGTYILSLTALNGVGCSDVFKDTIVIHPQPQANVLVQPTVGCAPLTTTFVNLSTNYTTTSWYYGDNTTPPPFVGNNSPAHTYALPDTYSLQVITNYQNVCFDTAIVPITVVPVAVPNFTYAPTSVVCGVPAPFTFTNLSQFAQNYYWDFGNGITSTAFDTTVIYTIADTFTIKLVSINALGCKDSMMQDIIINPQPQANITASPSQGCAPLTVNFTNNSTYSTHATWNYQDGTPLQNTIGNVGTTHIFTPVDTFNVTVIVDYEGICFDTAIVPVIVQPQPLASFTFTESGTHCGGPLTINLQSTTLYATSYLWYLGNGNTANTQNASVTYTVADTFTVTLIGTNAVGCKDTVSKDFILHPQPQALASAIPTVGCVPAILTVQNLSTFANAWTWNFGDSSPQETTFIPAPHTYFVPANDTLTLIANYQNVCFDTLRVPLSYGDRPNSIFAFSVSGDLCGGPAQIVTDNQSTLANTYLWNFGDNLNYSTQFNDSVIYNTAGDYLISLIATNDYCSDTTAQNYHLYDQVTANFIADTLAGCNPQPIAFTSTSINATDFAWYFGDTTSSTQNPVLHVYQDSGTYTVTLIASIGGVCPDTITKTGFIRINQSPIAAFEMQPEQTGSFDNVIHFINTTQFANQYYWDLGDGSTTTMETPEPHAYLTNDTVYATLIAINEYGCSDTLVKHVSMKPVYGLQIPNAFAPYSGTAKANSFMPIGYGLKEYEIAVYSTWGDLVWSSTAIDAEGRPTESWDGKDRNGNPMNSDVFVWEVHKAIFIGNVEWEGMKYGRKKEKAQRRGTVTIIK